MSLQSSQTENWFVTTFYKFKKQENLNQIQTLLEQKAAEFEVEGLLILGPDGVNSTCASKSPLGLESFKSFIRDLLEDQNLMFKDSTSPMKPFQKFKVKQRPEIVTIGAPDLFPNLETNHHLSPEEWDRVMREEDVLVIDTRNWYESDIGTFKGALTPPIEQFTEFPEWLDQQEFPKEKKMLIFCTGGIRCEKGIYELQRRGYGNVWQLEGGILNYIKEKPNQLWQGECFVFDQRVAVDQNLQPTQTYKLCPHCGQPAKTQIDCSRCDEPAHVCEACLKLDFKKETCSKNCAHFYQLYPGRKGKHQIRAFERP